MTKATKRWMSWRMLIIVPVGAFLLVLAALIYLATRAPVAPFVYR